MSFAVRYSESARQDLKRLYRYLLDRSTANDGLAIAQDALGAIVNAATVTILAMRHQLEDDYPCACESE